MTENKSGTAFPFKDNQDFVLVGLNRISFDKQNVLVYYVTNTLVAQI